MRRSEFKTLVTIGIIVGILAASIYGGFIDFTPSTVSADEDDDLDTTQTLTIENPYDLPDGMSIDSASYIIFKNGTQTCAKNGEMGYTEFYGADSSAVINRAIDAANGQIILIKAGTYEVNIDITKSVILEGVGNNTCLVRDDMSLPVITSDCVDNITLSKLSIDGTKATATSLYSVRLRNASNVNIEYCYFKDGGTTRTLEVRDDDGSGGYLAEISKIRIANNVFDQNTRNAIGSICAHDVQILNNIIYNAPDTAIEMSGDGNIHNALISGNQIVGANSGIITSELDYGLGARITISNNIIQNITANGINVQEPVAGNDTIGGVSITGNNIYDAGSGYSGISVTRIPHCLISNNNINGFDTGAIRINNRSAYTSVIGNTIKEHNNYAIIVLEDHCILSGNTIYGGQAGAAGINLRANYTSITGNTLQEIDGSVMVTAGHHHNTFNGNSFIQVMNGIYLVSATNNTISNNIFILTVYNTDIVESGTSDYNIITQNQFKNAYSITMVGAHDTIMDNSGYKTEGHGSAVISSGNVDKTVYHGLSGIVTTVVVTGSETETAGIYVSTIGSNYFVVTVPSAVSDNRTVYWYAFV